MTIKHHVLAFGVLAAAFAASALFQLYRSMLMEVPEYDAFTVTTAFAYATFVGVSALVLTDRLWAWWLVSALVLALLSVGVFWYYPVVVPARIEAGAMGLIGWLEASVYMGLLFVAGVVCALRLLSARLAPEAS
jgi:hypothetical protein